MCEKKSSISFPVAFRRPPRPLVNPRPGVRMFSSRRRRVSRQALPFLSLPHQSMCARIHRLNSRRIICYRATDLALRATKHTARAVGRPMARSVAAERHLWLNLTEISEKEEVFLLDAPISQSGLFGEAVSSVVEKFCSCPSCLRSKKGTGLSLST